MIRLKQKGDFSKSTRFLEKIKDLTSIGTPLLEKYGTLGVQALKEATPVDTGKTADSWSYEAKTYEEGRFELIFRNSNINKGVPIAVILQYGHGTGTGGWVEGRDYINPAIRPIFDELAKRMMKEVSEL